MTALIVLALTVPPSVAAIMWRLVAFFEAQARKLAEEQHVQLTVLAIRESTNNTLNREQFETNRMRLDHAEAELKRLNDQLSLIADRYR
jgi:hypothetical protein